MQRAVLLALLFLLSMEGGGSAGWPTWPTSNYTKYSGPETADPPPPPISKCVVEVRQTITVSGVLDGNGCTYVWKGRGYPNYCHTNADIPENMPRMFVMRPGSTLRNLQMECALDGILMNDNTTIESIVNRDCGDDCVTTNGRNNTIRNSKFYLCQNKCIQLNKAQGVTIENNEFYHAWRPMSGTNTAGAARGVRAVGNSCTNCDIMFLTMNQHEVYASKNVIDLGNCMFETQGGSVIYDQGGNLAKGTGKISCPHGTHNVVSKP